MKLYPLLALASLALLGCPEPHKKDDPVAPVEEVKGMELPEENPQGQTEEELRKQKLETKRADVESMINKIMSEDIYFDYDKSALTERARELLSKVGDILIKEKEFDVIVEGHTDARGTTSYNLSLGSSRSAAVQKYLIDYGVVASRIKTVSYGEEKPKVEGETEVSYNQNRRAHFQVKIRE